MGSKKQKNGRDGTFDELTSFNDDMSDLISKLKNKEAEGKEAC